jgi:hypothetical protein
MPDDFFAPPAFKPTEALVQLKRQLRDLRPMAERGNTFQLRGQDVVELQADDSTITARLAKRPARSPEWTQHTLKTSADLRRFVEAVKAQLQRWSNDE